MLHVLHMLVAYRQPVRCGLISVLAALAAFGCDPSSPAPPAPPAKTASTSAQVAVTESPEPASSASNTTSEPAEPALDPTKISHKYPVSPECVYLLKNCKTEKGEPGVRCGDDPVCFNPCPPGKGPEPGGMYCGRRCKTSAECGGNPCSPEGVCDRDPTPEGDCEGMCTLPTGFTGVLCDGKCQNPCKKGLFLYGGTHCVKQCKTNKDCPGGFCYKDEGWPYSCGPLCPTGGCPYQWE